jgi:hypothetical protein
MPGAKQLQACVFLAAILYLIQDSSKEEAGKNLAMFASWRLIEVYLLVPKPTPSLQNLFIDTNTVPYNAARNIINVEFGRKIVMLLALAVMIATLVSYFFRCISGVSLPYGVDFHHNQDLFSATQDRFNKRTLLISLSLNSLNLFREGKTNK